MKIFYLVSSYETGGAEFAIPSIVELFQKQGHEVRVTALQPSDGVSAVRLREAGIEPHLLFSRRQTRGALVIAAMKHIREYKPDIIWTSLSRATFTGQVAGKLLSIPVVSWWHTASLRRYTRLMRKLSRLWVADSPYVAQYLHEKIGVQSHNIMTWPIFRCSPSYDPPQAWHWDGQTPLRVGSVGRLHEVKNYPVLLHALSLFLNRNPEHAGRISLALAGEGPQRTELEQLVAELKLEDHVRFHGYLSDVQPFLKTLDFYIQPSRYEGMCLAMHEAMATGLPVAATPFGEMQVSLQEGHNGFVLSPDHLVQSICDVFETVFADPECLARLGQQGAAYVHRLYSAEAFARQGTAILKRIEKDILR